MDLTSQDSCGYSIKETTPVAEPVVSEKTEHAEISQYPSPEKDNGKVATLPGSAAGTSRKVESIIKSEVPVSSEEKVASLFFSSSCIILHISSSLFSWLNLL